MWGESETLVGVPGADAEASWMISLKRTAVGPPPRDAILEEQDPALPMRRFSWAVRETQLSSARDTSTPATRLAHLLLQLFKNALSRLYWKGNSESKRLSTLSRAPAPKDRDEIRVDSKAI